MALNESAIALDNVRIRRRQLWFAIGNSDETQTIRLPFGSGITVGDYRFAKKILSTSNYQIQARRNADEKSGRYTILFPGYEARDFIKDPDTGSKISIRLWVVDSERDRLAPRQVIERVHYLADSGRGMFLGCSFSDREEQLNLRKGAQKNRNRDPEDISWMLALGGVVGCGVIDTLWHGNPISGRALIAEELKLKGNKWKNWSRRDVIEHMRVAWGSRFAIDMPYQGLGLGTVIAKHLKRVARLYHAPSADFLEVITTTAKGQPSKTRHDFLQRAGYTQLPTDLKSGSLMVMDKDTGYTIPRPAVKHYYYADVRHEF
jgi:hypothetical protein